MKNFFTDAGYILLAMLYLPLIGLLYLVLRNVFKLNASAIFLIVPISYINVIGFFFKNFRVFLKMFTKIYIRY